MTVIDMLQSVQYMVDEEGIRTAAVIDIDAWETLIQRLDLSNSDTIDDEVIAKTPDQVIACVQARPIDPATVIKPKGSLLDALLNSGSDDEEFDLAEWTQQWEAVEQEMEDITRRNDIAEGRG